MNDRDFLYWLHERLRNQHRESELKDYMHKLRAIILSTPPNQDTPNDGRGGNGWDDLANRIVRADKLRAEGWFQRLRRRLSVVD